MSRPRNQEGSISIQGGRHPKWYGEFRSYIDLPGGKQKAVHRSFVIGKVSEVTKEEARRALQKRLDGEREKYDAYGRIINVSEQVFAARPKAALHRIAATGVMCELLATSDLLGRGFEVFKPVNPCCPFDLLCMSGATFFRIEVKGGTLSESGRPRCDITNRGKFDALALVTPDGRICYFGADGKTRISLDYGKAKVSATCPLETSGDNQESELKH